MNTEMIPENKIGKGTDLKQTKTINTQQSAIRCYERARKRLLNPPIWHELMGSFSGKFKVTGENGKDVDRLLQVKDYIKINLPAPNNRSGDGFDWVRVEKVIDASLNENEFIALRLRAAANPQEERENNAATAHFFDERATSTFIIERIGNTITAAYHGRNEVPNKNTNGIIDNMRNSIVAAVAMIGLSEMQWTALIKAFLQDEING